MCWSTLNEKMEKAERAGLLKKDFWSFMGGRDGSAIKMCRMAEGNAALYPRFGTTMEWDTAAGQAILEQVGGCLHAFPANSPMRYNRPVLRNPDFLAVAPGVDARKALAIMETVAGK